jgi:hypothetical protein
LKNNKIKPKTGLGKSPKRLGLKNLIEGAILPEQELFAGKFGEK